MTAEDRLADRLAWLSLAVFSSLWLARWPTFPIGSDPAYHLFIAQQVVEAGGPLGYEWWQWAPVGRPHVYPPLLHLLIAGLLGIGCPAIVAIRLVTAIVVPAVYGTIYVVSARLFGRRVALGSVWLALVPFGFGLHIADTLASGLALIELLWFLVAVVERRAIATACLLALMSYTHLGIPWVALVGVGWAVLLRAIPADRALWSGLGGGVLLGLPWLWHLMRHLPSLHIVRRAENALIDLAPILLLLGVIGAWHAWKRKGRWRLWLSLGGGFCAMAFVFTFRWLSGEGLLPIILLAGFGLAACAEALTRRWSHGRAQWRWIALLAGAAFLSPSVMVSREVVWWRWFDSSPFHLMNWAGLPPKPTDIQLFRPAMERWADTVQRLTQPREILWSNASYAGGLVASLAHRPTSSAMFYEVGPSQPVDPLEAAHWVLWFKVPPEPGQPILEAVRQRPHLTVVTEDDVAILFHDARTKPLARQPQAVLPWWLAWVVTGGLCSLAVWDLRRLSTRP